MPDLAIERKCGGLVAGVDEAGRGPLAGPVIAAAVILPRRLPPILRNELDDSKKLLPKHRRELFAVIGRCAEIGIGGASVAEIDRHNILAASHIAMCRALARLRRRPDVALVDGNLLPRSLPCEGLAVIGGDGLSLSIAAASIVAKVTRDRIMSRLAPRYPDFGWETNAGYGTPQHQDGLARAGITRHHRTSFSPIAQMLSPPDPGTPDIA